MKLNEKPFELLGFTSNDYIIWCKTIQQGKAKYGKSVFKRGKVA